MKKKRYRYVQEERAYHLNTESPNIAFELTADNNSPLVNPSFVIHNWEGNKVELKINGETITPGINFRTGIIHTAEGKNLNVWLKYTSTKNTRFEFY